MKIEVELNKKIIEELEYIELVNLKNMIQIELNKRDKTRDIFIN